MRSSRPILLLSLMLAFALLSACQRPARLDSSTRHLLSELDGYVAAREVYVAKKLDQMDALRKKGIDFDICPGVSSMYAAAAALQVEYTLPEVSHPAKALGNSNERFIISSA